MFFRNSLQADRALQFNKPRTNFWRLASFLCAYYKQAPKKGSKRWEFVVLRPVIPSCEAISKVSYHLRNWFGSFSTTSSKKILEPQKIELRPLLFQTARSYILVLIDLDVTWTSTIPRTFKFLTIPFTCNEVTKNFWACQERRTIGTSSSLRWGSPTDCPNNSNRRPPATRVGT